MRLPAQMAELVDALVSGTSAARRGGSSPLLGTSFREKPAFSRLFSLTTASLTTRSPCPRPAREGSWSQAARPRRCKQAKTSAASSTVRALKAAAHADHAACLRRPRRPQRGPRSPPSPHSGAKRMTTQNRFVALGPGRNHVDRNFTDLLDPMQVGARLMRQRVPALSTYGGATPA